MQFAKDHPTLRRARRAPAAAGFRFSMLGAAVLLSLLAGCEGAGEQAGESQAAIEDDAAKASYSLGYRFAENVQRQFGEDLSQDAFLRGVSDKLAGAEAAVSDEEAQRVLTEMMEARQAQAAGDALDNLEEGLSFLEKNAQREGVIVLESGLQYEVLEEGEGEKPDASDLVTTHYEGRLIDGTVFDSSYQRGEPATFPLNRVIPGWTQGLQLMSPGAKYRLYVPADMAYGERGAGDSIPPNSVLIFDVELLGVQQDEEPAPDAAAADADTAGAESAEQ